MPVKLSDLLKNIQKTAGVAPTLREYEDRSRKANSGGLEGIRSDYKKFANLYYDLVTDFYEYGWAGLFTLRVASPERASRHRLLATNTILRTYSGSDPGWSSLTSVAALADH